MDHMDLSDGLASLESDCSVHRAALHASVIFIDFCVRWRLFTIPMKSLQRTHIQVKRIGKVAKLFAP